MDVGIVEAGEERVGGGRNVLAEGVHDIHSYLCTYMYVHDIHNIHTYMNVLHVHILHTTY